MNNIYKVIWSKAKNCYVVASEIAKSHTKSASGSEKMGGYGKKALLALAAASAIFCGGLVNVGATVRVNGVTDGANEVYTTTEVNTELGKKANADSVYTKGETYTKDEVNTELGKKANADSVYTKGETYTKDEVNTELGKKANAGSVYTKGETYTKDEVNTELGKKADANNVYTKTEADGTFATSDALTTAKNELDGKIDANTTKINDLQTTTAGQADAIKDLKDRTTNISYDSGKQSTSINGIEIGSKQVDMGGKDLTHVGTINGIDIGDMQVDMNGKNLTGVGTINGIDLGTVDTQVKTNADAIAKETEDRKAAIGELTVDGKYIKKANNVSDNLVELDKQAKTNADNIQTNANNIKINKDEIARVNGELVKTNDYFNAELGKTNDYFNKELSKTNNHFNTELGKTNAALQATNKRTAGIDRIDATSETTIEKNVTVDNKGNVTAKGKLKGEVVDAGAVNAGSLSVENASTLKGDVTMDKKLSVTGETLLGKTDVGGALTVTGKSDLKNTTVGGTLGVTGETTLGGTLTAEKDATFEKNVTVQKDLTVDGKLNVDKISMKNDELKNGKKHDSATTITADEISNLAKVTEQGNTTESQFTHNEKGTFNYAKDEKSTGEWKRATSNVTADGVSNKMTDSDGNTHTYYQTATESKEQLVNGDKSKSNFEKKTAEGNTISITEKDADGNLKSSLTNTQTVNGEKTSVTNEDSSSTINQGADQIRYNVTSKDENKTSSSIEVKADGITNTSKDGTITNTAKNVTNEGTESVTNKVGNNEVKVSQNGVDIKAEAGKKIKESVGTTSRVVENDKITDTAGDSTVTTEKGKGTTFGNGSTGTTNIYGDSIKTGTIKAKDTTTDTLTAGAAADADGGRLTVDANDGVKGSYKSGDYTSRSYILANTLMSGVDNGKKPTDADFVGSRTDHYMDGNNAKLDETVKDAAGSNVTNKTSTDTVTTITDGNTTTKTEQGVKDITNTATAGTITNNAKDIVNDAQDTITNTAGTSITNKVKDSEVTTDVGGTTFENKTAAVSDGGTTTTKINGNRITTGRVDANELGVSDKDGTNSAALSVKAGEGVKASAGNGTTTGSLDVTAGEVGSSVTDASGNGSTFKQRIDAIMGNVKNNTTGEESSHKQTSDVITDNVKNNTTGDQSFHKQTSDVIMDNVKDGKNSNNRTQTKTETKDIITDENDNSSTTSQTASENKTYLTDKDRKNTNSTIDTAKGYDKTIKGENGETSTQQTDSMVQSYVGKKDGSATNVTTNFANASANQVTENGQTSTVLNNKDGLLIQNTANGNSFTTEDGTPTGPAQSWTNIKGNEISTGKVEANYVKMGYADVMKDLGVHGNAKIAGKTTTGSLEVTGTSKLTGNVTMENDATVGHDLTVNGTTKTKTLNVTENATVGGTLDVTQKATFHNDVDITGDVTARSYKVGDKTYISAAGINANDQKITNVANGSISEGSKDAVNGGQLYGMKMDLEHKVDKVGANAAAMANLHPMEFDPDSKWNIAAAMGNYGSETATAIGAFYRPNEDVMVNFSTAFGTGENMVGGGVSVRLGKGSNKLSREESNALKDQVNDLTARMDALLSVLNPNMSKDFPDVPENHWAYEAVSRLAGNDIVQGYPDGEFHGERTMTRYEMAEIIYNALSRGAEAEKELVEEFKPELQAMAASEKATAERAEG